ncbi:integrase catalytic domain-containing protein [Trichonephila clavipes]|uniref:Integrase catalytic domain-containing protein n=1 Tax=Trichonephila clavipes TaxID=2585209 RepID=A0A8X6WDV4_TRICX|nr:integrase catalytic domain-containing protein [Trichonephila clavipes]
MALNKDPSCLGNSKDIAIRRLNSLWKRLSRDSSYLSLYAEFLKEYEELGHLERVVESSEPPTHYYIPHHGVLRPEKLTTKLRIVFNGGVKEDVFESEVLSVIAKLYDPLGFLGPVIAKAKVFLQQLWQYKLDWDDVLPNSIANEWREFVTTLKCIEEVKINRFIMADNNVRIVLQGFADAFKRPTERSFTYSSVSQTGGAIKIEIEKGGASIESLRSTDLQCFLHNGAAKGSILASKSRVAPIRVISIPRLELCACVLLAQLVKKIRSTLRLNISDIVLHTDFNYCIGMVKYTPANRLKTFVANRVAKVQELTEGFQWNHVPSVLNPADLVPRGLHPCDLPNLRLWWHGPQFLGKGKLSSEETSLSPVKECEYSKELKTGSSSDIITSSVCVSTNCVSSILSTLLCKSNSYIKIVRIFSYVLRFSNNVNKRKLTLSGPLSATDIDQAETKLIRMVQEQVFLAEIKSLQSKGVVSPNSKLRNLNPFIDSDGLLRIGGWLSNSDLPYVNKHPAILPGNHNLTVQIFVHFHRKNLHTGASSLLHYVREKFWPLNGRSLCKKVEHECLVCFKSRPLVTSQLMGNLPHDRVVPDYPFNCSGVDFCGPFMIRHKNQRKGILHKIYICVFVCFVSKAIHIEIVSDLTSDAFIATLKRFFSRRGKCAKLYSDNGKTFVGANKELKRFLKLIEDSDDNLAGFLSAEGIEWKFIPPRAPSFGGLWEASVKSIKYHLRRVVSGSNLTYEEFLTVCIQIEGILNSRPLCPLSSNSDDLNALTPAHFLIGKSMTSVVETNLIELKENALKKWQRITRLVQLIWNKWHRCYLSELQQCNKWQFKKQNVNEGDLVVLIEDNMPTFKWPLGRITEIYSGSDALIRVVKGKSKDMLQLAEELGINATLNMTVPSIKIAITNSEGYEEEFVKNLYETIIANGKKIGRVRKG